MKNLIIPLKDVDERTIYYSCADRFRDKTALGYIEDVVSSAAEYKRYVPLDIEHLPKHKINSGDEKEIIKVYTNKFAKKDSIGYKYYEAILTNANGCCPICGGGKVKNLDHFLPKSVFPLFCVLPANLIPLCRDCNFDKNSTFVSDYYSLPFNPYFDVMQDEWLECSIVFREDNTFEIEYCNGYDKSKNEQLWWKYETHLTVFDLNATFSARACEEIDNCKYEYKALLQTCGIGEVYDALVEHRNSCEINDMNSWKSALYRELSKKTREYCNWLANGDENADCYEALGM